MDGVIWNDVESNNFCVLKIFFLKNNFFIYFKLIFLMLSNRFNMLILKINFKK